jgi:tRNA 2-thiouridine synthesizing protein A
MLVVTASDAGTLQDIPAWCRVHGHRLVTTEQTEEDIEKGRTYRFTICVVEQ